MKAIVRENYDRQRCCTLKRSHFRTFGTEATAACSTRNIEVVRSIGADHVLDYTKDDFAALGQRYDLILAVNGDRSIWTVNVHSARMAPIR